MEFDYGRHRRMNPSRFYGGSHGKYVTNPYTGRKILADGPTARKLKTGIHTRGVDYSRKYPGVRRKYFCGQK